MIGDEREVAIEMRRRKRTRTEPITRKSLADKTIDDARTLVVIAFHEREMGLPGFDEATAGEGTPPTMTSRVKPINLFSMSGRAGIMAKALLTL